MIVTVAVASGPVVFRFSKLPPVTVATAMPKLSPSAKTSSPCAACGAELPVVAPAAKLITTPLSSVTDQASFDAAVTLAVYVIVWDSLTVTSSSVRTTSVPGPSPTSSLVVPAVCRSS